MSPDILEELKSVGTACMSGAVVTAVYDGLRIFRRIISHGNFWIGVEDFLFWIWTALWMFSVLYRENDGNLRMYTMISMAVGMILYHKMISEPLVGFLGKWINQNLKLFLILFKKENVLKYCICFYASLCIIFNQEKRQCRTDFV